MWAAFNGFIADTSRISFQNAAFALIWIAVWFTRSKEDLSRWGDLYLFIFFQIWSKKAFIFSQLTPIRYAIATIFTILVSCILLLTSIALSRNLRSHRLVKWNNIDCTKPLILRCRTSHTRMFPKRHTFSYRYLQVSVPVGFNGSCSRLLSVGQDSTPALFRVDARDYLIRDSKRATLEGKLEEYLESQVGVSLLIYIIYAQ
jgi:Protein of unknown function (DUF1365)